MPRFASTFAWRFAWTFTWMFIWIATPAMFAAAPVAAQTAIPDVRGTWKGDSESIVLDAANPHHAPTQSNEPHLRSAAFTLTIDKQDGRRFSGRLSSARGSERVIAVFSRSGTILLADDDGTTLGTMLAPNRMELCHLHVSPTGRVASCLELTKQQ
jgi:hypothetical protein